MSFRIFVLQSRSNGLSGSWWVQGKARLSFQTAQATVWLMLFRRFRWRCGTFSTLGGNAFFAKKVRNIQQAASGPPAHLVYDPSQLPDAATLLLVAKSAVSSDFKDQAFWQACSLQARKLCGADANLLALARYAVAAATVHHQDTELMNLSIR